MALNDLKLIQASSKDVMDLQANTFDYVRQLNGNLLSGVIIENVAIGTTTTSISHRLGRKFLGWHLLDIQGDARVWRDSASTLDLTKFLPLKASGAVTVNLWVF